MYIVLMAFSTSRQQIRVLYITSDTSLLHPNGKGLELYQAVAAEFDEMHIMVLRTGLAPKNPVLRVGKNIWVYTVSHDVWWRAPIAALKTLHQELYFGNTFRADLIIATDPYESAALAWWLGRTYHRLVQVHVYHDIMRTSKKEKQDSRQRWRTRIALWVLPKVASVRTSTEALAVRMKTLWPQIPQIEVLPRFYRPVRKIGSGSSILKTTFPQFSFVFVYVGPLTYDGDVSAVIDAARVPLSNAHVGLIIIGDGNARHEYKRRVKSYGLEANVVFVHDESMYDTYVSEADAVLIPSVTPEADDLLLFAAQQERAIIATETTFRRDVFGVNALQLMPLPTMVSLMTEMNHLLNDYGLRRSVAQSARAVSEKIVNTNNDDYSLIYRRSIERGLWANDEVKKGTI